MRLTIEHQTQYVYSEPVIYTIQQLRLSPLNGLGQHVKHWEIRVDGQLDSFMDTYGNLTHTLVIDKPHVSLLISVAGEVETGVDGLIPRQSLPLPFFLRDTALTKADTAMQAFASKYNEHSLEPMMHALRDRMQYIKGATEVNTTAAQAFALSKGVCQDHTHAFIGCCRSIGVPARYVSGYLFTEDGSLMQTHAWVEVWQQGLWVGMDVSNGVMVDETHVRLATGLDYRSASPVTGMRNGGGVEGMSSTVIVNQQQKMTVTQRKQSARVLLQQAQAAQQQQ